METVIVILILAAVLGAAVGYIICSRKKGRKCIGCPDSGRCAGCCQNCQSKHE